MHKNRFSFNDDAVELYAERVAKRGLCAQTQVRGWSETRDSRISQAIIRLMYLQKIDANG